MKLGLRTSVGPAVLLDAALVLDRQLQGSATAPDGAARARSAALLVQLNALATHGAQGRPPLLRRLPLSLLGHSPAAFPRPTCNLILYSDIMLSLHGIC